MEHARKFNIIVNSKECGTCSGPTPSAVAKKVVKKLCGTSSKAVRFSLKECKRGCERVCGPYQGRMEKLDRPYKRDGKTITHRVVCGKVRKMRGGSLGVHNFRKKDDDGDFKPDTYFFKPIIFFGKIEVTEGQGENNVTREYYEFAIFNKEHRGGTVGILQLVKNNDILEVKIVMEDIFDTLVAQNNNGAAAQNNNGAAVQNNNGAAAQNNNGAAAQNNNGAAAQNNNGAAAQKKLKDKLKEELKALYNFLKRDKTIYKRIRGFICHILKIDEKNNIPEIFKGKIPNDYPEGFEYIPYVAYQDKIENFDEKFYNSLPKNIKFFKPDSPPPHNIIKKFDIPEIIDDPVNRNYKLYDLKTSVYAYIVSSSNKNSEKKYKVYFGITKGDFTVALIYNEIIYIGIVYNNNDQNVVIFYPILIKYDSPPETDLIYSVYYLFIIIIESILYTYFYMNNKYILHNFYYKYISRYITHKLYKKGFHSRTNIENNVAYNMTKKLSNLKKNFYESKAMELRRKERNNQAK